ncbi:MAG: hypothetical protein IH965_12750, partial [Gemmatimonadetes bacterium]|nr:hypothetical protein [Gemmatimonadota bacterium]
MLKQAGFPTEGYSRGGPTSFTLSSFLVGWDGRPQEFGSQLALGEVDIAISGEDWIRERQLEMEREYGKECPVTKVLPLGRGGVRLVIINNDEEGRECDDWLRPLLTEKPLVTMVSEMPHLAIEWFQRKAAALGFGQSHSADSIQKYKTEPKISAGLVVYETWGKTEAKVKNGSVDFGLEITQSGSAIRNYGLHIADEVMKSEAAVWANPALKDDPEKYELARMFLLNLHGAIFAEDKVLVLFNAATSLTAQIVDYLESNKLFAEEPTMNEGVNFVE